MAGFNVKNDELCADDVPLSALATHYGTPSYIYSAGIIRAQAARLQSAMRRALPASRQPLIAFAVKANSNLSILRELGTLGIGADIVSGGELACALKADIPPARIVFSGVGKLDEEIEAALRHGVRQINVESPAEVQRIAVIAKRLGVVAPISFRVNPDVDARTHAKITTGKEDNKFGIDGRAAIQLYQEAINHPHLKPRGFSVHIGSQLLDLTPFRDAFRHVARLVSAAREAGLSVEAIDLGGGVGVPYRGEPAADLDVYAALIAEIIAPLETEIMLEPGRLFVAEAGILLTRVIDIKSGPARNFMILDAGMNDLMRPALYDAWHPIRPVKNPDRPEITYDIVGPVCETGDTFATARTVPEVRPGDLVAIMMAGAYGFSMASNYNMRALPAEVLVDGDRHALIRQRQAMDDLLRDDVTPQWRQKVAAA